MIAGWNKDFERRKDTVPWLTDTNHLEMTLQRLYESGTIRNCGRPFKHQPLI